MPYICPQIFAGDSNLQLHVRVGFTGVRWKEDMLDKESNAFTSFTENVSNNVRVSCCILSMSYHSIIIIILIRSKGKKKKNNTVHTILLIYDFSLFPSAA